MNLFITGTDTGVGKTMVCAALLRAFRKQGRNSAPLKPVQTGCHKSSGTWRAPDLDFALSKANLDVSEQTYQLMTPYKFEPACSPHLAAEMANTRIETSLIRQSLVTLEEQFEDILVEGAGGLMVPLNQKKYILDLIVELDLAVLLVARPGLGTLNHTLLSLEVLRRAGIQVLGVVVVESTPPKRNFIEKDNLKTIALRGKTKILASVPYLGDKNAFSNSEALSKCANQIAQSILP